MAIPISTLSKEQLANILSKSEGHFLDFKSKAIAPARLTKTLSAFANADGGELYIGIQQRGSRFHWDGFGVIEDANGHIQAIEEFFPLVSSFRHTFLQCDGQTGIVLLCEIEKTADIRYASDRVAYLRRGAQNLPQDTTEKVDRLKYSKGIVSFEDQKLNADAIQISNSLAIIEFALEIIPTAEPDVCLKKQHLIVEEKPTVAGAVLFSDEPQVSIPKAAIKVYRYKTRDAVGTRDTLAFNPISIEGNAYGQIYDAVAKIKKIAEEIPLMTLSGFEKIEYPTEAIHEVVTNAVISIAASSISLSRSAPRSLSRVYCSPGRPASPPVKVFSSSSSQ